MALSKALGPFTFFFILYCHISVFSIVCMVYATKWHLSSFYANVICSWIGKATIALTVVTILSAILTIMMSTINKLPKKILPSINAVFTIAMLTLALVVGVRSKTSFIQDYQTYIAKMNDNQYLQYYQDFNNEICPSDKDILQCKKDTELYIYNRTGAIGSYILTILLNFSVVQIALTGYCMFIGPIFGGKQ